MTTQLASLQAKFIEANANKSVKDPPSQIPSPQKQDTPVEDEFSGDEDSEEDSLAIDWSGKVIDRGAPEVGISNEAFNCWDKLIALDEPGQKSLKFKETLQAASRENNFY